uniref:Secreted protein n=1 Tax=Ascaris lumbricoides TaxID=6252 RepID=A0A0M3IUI5_ASCLU
MILRLDLSIICSSCSLVVNSRMHEASCWLTNDVRASTVRDALYSFVASSPLINTFIVGYLLTKYLSAIAAC